MATSVIVPAFSASAVEQVCKVLADAVTGPQIPNLIALPDEPFETGLLLSPRVDRYSQVTVRCCRYSVPVRLAGRQVRVVLRSTEVIVYDRQAEVARHQRLTVKGAESLKLDHYLEVLMRKPGALPGAAALEQARAAGAFNAPHLVALVRAGATFINGKLVERPGEEAQKEAA